MTPSLPKLDRRLALGGLVLLTSLALLGVGLFSIIATLTGDAADLPSEGSLNDILSDADLSGQDLAATATADQAAPPGPAPVRIVIPRLYIEAPVVALGLLPDNYPDVPDEPDEVAWYTFSAVPGRSSNAVFSGHVDWITRRGDPIPGVFYRLRELEIGDVITVNLDDGSELRYRVTGNVATAYDDPDVVKVMQGTSKDVITLITCGGTWQKDYRAPFGGNYSHRVIVRAERVQGLAEGGAGGG
ncbi:MAG: class F sortase [Chloroflexi bacterium]|nr:class F sortase [Chloroflexota bacterium]